MRSQRPPRKKVKAPYFIPKKLDILFEDQNYIAVNKPAGLPVHKTLDKKRPNLFNLLQEFLKKRDNLSSLPYLGLNHRLDSETSGVILFSKSKEVNPILDKLFKTREIKKTYLALVKGKLKETTGSIENYLDSFRVKGRETIKVVQKGGKKALSHFSVVQEKKDLSLVQFKIKTGRMHQIRVHTNNLETFILGDKTYGDSHFNKKFGIKRQMLHASSLYFWDPVEKKEIFIEAPLPSDMKSLLEEGELQAGERFQYIAFNKPYGVLSQFSGEAGDHTLSDFNLPAEVYPAGRLDKDSEGLLILSNDGDFINKISHPKFFHEKTYWVQVEKIPSEESLDKLRKGVQIKDYTTRPCQVRFMDSSPEIPERNPPIRFRKSIPTCWLEIKISEGKNRQVRRMTAAIGHPTLRLIRARVEKVELQNIPVGGYIALKRPEIYEFYSTRSKNF